MAGNAGSGSGAYVSSEEHLRDELHRVAGFLRAHLLRFRYGLPETHRERFWHLSDDYLEEVARDQHHSPLDAYAPEPKVAGLLEWVEDRREAISRRAAATHGVGLRLERLRGEFGLDVVESDALLLATLPLLHARYRRLYGVLQHDPARGLASAGLLAEMLSTRADEFAARLAAVAPAGRLAYHRLLVLGGTDDDLLPLRGVAVDDCVIQFLLGHDQRDARLLEATRWHREASRLRDLPLPTSVANRLELLPDLRSSDPRVVAGLRLEFSGPDSALAVRAFGAVASELGLPCLVVEADRIGEAAWPVALTCALREARLLGGAVMFTGLESLLSGDAKARMAGLMTRLAAFPRPAAIELGSGPTSDGRNGAQGWIPFHLPAPTLEQREALWTAAFNGKAPLTDRARQNAADLAGAFQLTDSQIRAARRAAVSLARRRHVFKAEPERDDFFAACRTQSTTQLVAFATRIEPRRDLTLDDLVLPPANRGQLLELCGRIRNHARVYRAMELGEGLRLGRGVAALFVGGSGTGKGYAAEVLAAEQRVDLYRVDLAALVSKWVGETEKNLSRVFAEAEQANCMLFFDEADALFGQRGEVKEARDRWANLEVNYLLQRIEEYSGVVILATNLRQNIDEAFQRRLHALVEFPMPEAASRREIWRRLLPGPEHLVLGEGDVDELARRFDLSGGSIRNVVLAACFRAMESADRLVTLRHLVASVAREYQKAMRPVTLGDFGPEFHAWAMEDVIAPTPDAVAGAG